MIVLSQSRVAGWFMMFVIAEVVVGLLPSIRHFPNQCRSPNYTVRGLSIMEAVLPGTKCLVLGAGNIHLLTAKQAAIAGYDTYIFSAQDPEESLKLLYADGVACPRDSIPLTIMDVRNRKDCEDILASIEAVVVASDSDVPVRGKIIDTAVPEDEEWTTKVKKIVLMSRNGGSGRPGSGQELGFLASSAKGFSNPEVWAGGSEYIQMYTSLERKVMSKAERVGADYSIVRAGTLKGGGPGAKTTSDGSSYPHAFQSLSEAIYKDGPAGRNWRSLFDTAIQGVTLNPGDTTEGPGLKAVIASTSFEVQKGDSGRLAVANALVQCLRQPSAANTDFSVGTKESRTPPTQEEWDLLFGGLKG